MLQKIARNGKLNTLLLIAIISTVLSLFLLSVSAQPIGPTISVLGNTTKSAAVGGLVDSNINGTISPGGFIFTMNLDSLQQNVRWKAYVGNVTGTLTLDDADDNTIFQWSLTSVTGEVYATRASGTINWSGVNCTWIADGQRNGTGGFELSNRTPEHDENIVLSHSGVNDNISATFGATNHSQLTVGGVIIGKDECFTSQTYQNDAAQTFADSDDANFTQILLYDGAFNKTTGNLIHATFIEEDVRGYRSDSTYDFQIILPEDGTPGFSGSTGYYFYVELT